MTMEKGTLINLLCKHEGIRLRPYRDTAGKLTIGVGRCLDTLGITEREARYFLHNDILRVWKEARAFDWFDGLSDCRKMVVLSMLFNLGLPRFTQFKLFISAVERADYDTAAKEMLNSKWHKDVGWRAEELSEMMRTDKLPAGV